MSVDPVSGGDGVEGPLVVSPERPVCIVGGGVAGLSCALRLHRAGIPVRLFEAADRVGGRVRSELVDGFTLDRGFQVLLDSYDELAEVIDTRALRLRAFEPGCIIRWQGRFYPLFDPIRRPSSVTRMMGHRIGTLRDWMKVVALRARWLGRKEVRFDEYPGMSVHELLVREGFSHEMIEVFFRPFFSGVFLEYGLTTAACFFPFIFSRFSAGLATLPEGGMQAIADQMVAGLPAGSVMLGTPIAEITGDEVIDHRGERCPASVVVDARSLLGNDRGSAHSTAVHYCEVPTHLPDKRTLYVGAGTGTLLHVVAPLSDVQPTYAPPGRHLVAITCYPYSAQEGSGKTVGEQLKTEICSWFRFAPGSVRLIASYTIPRALGRFFSASDRAPLLRDGRYQIGDITEYPSLNGALLSGRVVAERIVRLCTI